MTSFARQRAALRFVLVSPMVLGGCAALAGVDAWEGSTTAGAGGSSGPGGSGGAACEGCPSSSCVDGVCCDGPCDGLCFACVASKTGVTDGTCAPTLAGTDPDDDCTMPAADVCGPAIGTCGCADGLQNGGETGVDCGGPTCVACGSAETACVDGLDDDSDGDVDCDDRDCSSVATCLPQIPAGWTAGALYVGAAAPAGCPGTFQIDLATGGIGLEAMPAVCGGCACGAATGLSCAGAAFAAAYAQDACDGAIQMGAPPTGTCFDVGPDATNVESVLGGPVAAMGGSCGPVSGGVSVPPAAFAQNARFCGTDVVSAPAGCDACALDPPGPFGPSPCIGQSGDLSCPSGFGTRTLFHTDIADDRSCSACGCSAPVGGSCTAALQLFEGDGCSGQLTSFAADGSCKDAATVPKVGSAKVEVSGGFVGASCTAIAPAPTGSAQGTDPYTVCCL